MRTIDWRGDHIVVIDQTKLPGGVVELSLRTVDELVIAIQRLAVRGAPALGAAGALGVALAVRTSREPEADIAALRAARPTAVNLARGVDRVLARLDDGPEAVLAEALDLLAEDGVCNRALGDRGASWLTDRIDGPVAVHTHCNAGGLACVEWGTALGVVRSLHDRNRLRHVYVDETRPLLQGARLTAWELAHLGVPHTLVADAAGPTVLARGFADAVVVGADRVVANGDVVNKIGTYPLALAAARAGIPFLVAAPESTVDASIPSGDQVEIEVRDGAEVLAFAGTRTAPAGTQALNIAFDVTPADLVTAIVTEDRIVEPARGERVA
ncbi:S-methyl-5-thioribose-1-phosphate isomerase [Actinophytocola gossypii]|uniref:Methylthioribose-1-phosphate isomerase n=1 Tax=Actinophytocola gossypii TaxID=2812003 RepID=A0ABT2J9X4_9PSEU|nr:S-methyl-5-thioribose-1-phosphate isomerase [Actinophytocola gossypii]MCT2584668.1 S-methyl-5-thioribose-1-phosphate isomerase [Actinophytocola gossypii]